MRGILALALFIFLAASQCQEYSDMQSPILGSDESNIAVIAYVCEVSNNTAAIFYEVVCEAAKEERYNITVVNNGDLPLYNINVTAELAKGIMFKNADYYEPRSGCLVSEIYPFIFDENTKTKVMWSIGSLEPNQRKTILMNAYLKQKDSRNKSINVDSTNIKVNAAGSDSSVLVSDSVSRAQPAPCVPVDEYGLPCSEWHRELGICTESKCPDWCY